MSELKSISLFDTILYQAHVPKYLEDKDFIAVCNENTDKAIKNTQQKIDQRNKKFKTDVKDHGCLIILDQNYIKIIGLVSLSC